MSLSWTGPREIVEAESNYVYTEKDLVTEKREAVNCRRLWSYRLDMDEKEVEAELVTYAERYSTLYRIAKAFHDIRDEEDQICINIESEGLPDDDDMI